MNSKVMFRYTHFYKPIVSSEKMISWLEKNRVVPRTITLLIFISIFYISSLTFPPPVAGPANINAIAYHIFIFFLLAIFLFVSVLDRKWDFKKIILSLSITTIYAALDELHQFFVPGRYMSFSDFLFDFMGIILASLFYFILIFWKES